MYKTNYILLEAYVLTFLLISLHDKFNYKNDLLKEIQGKWYK